METTMYELGVEYRDAPVQWFAAMRTREDAEREARLKSAGPRMVGGQTGQHHERLAYHVRPFNGEVVSSWANGERVS
jgi:hypothetical protein